MALNKWAVLILRAGVAFAFLFPALNAFVDPFAWIGYFPPFTRGIVSDTLLLHVFGAVEVVLALWVLSGWRIFVPSAAMTAMLLGIVVFNPNEFQILFRDVSIAAMAFVLAMVSWGDERKSRITGAPAD